MNVTDYINKFVVTDFLGIGGGGSLYKKWAYTCDQYIRLFIPKYNGDAPLQVSFPVAYSNVLNKRFISSTEDTEIYLPSYKIYSVIVNQEDFLRNYQYDRRGKIVRSKLTFVKKFWNESTRVFDCHTVQVVDTLYVGGRSFLYDVTHDQLIYYFTGEYIFNGQVFVCPEYTLHVNNYIFRHPNELIHKLLCKDTLPRWASDGFINVRKFDIHNYGHLKAYPLNIQIHTPEEMEPNTTFRAIVETPSENINNFLHNIADRIHLSNYPPAVTIEI